MRHGTYGREVSHRDTVSQMFQRIHRVGAADSRSSAGVIWSDQPLCHHELPGECE